MNSATMSVVRRKDVTAQDFRETWNRMPAKAQGEFYRAKCAEMLSPPRYAALTPGEVGAIFFMRDNMKKMPNGRAHPQVEPLMSC